MRVGAHNLGTAHGTTLRLHESRRPPEVEPVAREDLEDPSILEDPCYRRIFNPRYVQACQGGQWCLNLVNRTTGKIRTVPYRCRSWRCTAKWVDHKTGKLTSCQRWKAAQNYARIREALAGYRAQDIVLAVFTYEAPKGADPQVAFDKLEEGWPLLRKRLHRMYGAFEYVATVEITRRGWPHLNVIMAGGGVGLMCDTKLERPYTDRDGKRQTRTVYTLNAEERQHLTDHLETTGMGRVCTMERATSGDAISGYVVKVAGEWEKEEGEGTAAAEVVKLSQVPVNAKKGFRRLRSSVGFLPPVYTSKSDWTGWLARTDNGMPVAPLSGGTTFPDYARPEEPWLQHRAEPAKVYTLRTARWSGEDVGKDHGPEYAHQEGQEKKPIVYSQSTASCSSVSSPTWDGVRVSYTFARISAGVSFTKAANDSPAASSSAGSVNRFCMASDSGMAARCSGVNDSVSSVSISAAPRASVGGTLTVAGAPVSIPGGVNGFAGCSCLGCTTWTGPPWAPWA